MQPCLTFKNDKSSFENDKKTQLSSSGLRSDMVAQTLAQAYSVEISDWKIRKKTLGNLN